jgi:hypothetical protein
MPHSPSGVGLPSAALPASMHTEAGDGSVLRTRSSRRTVQKGAAPKSWDTRPGPTSCTWMGGPSWTLHRHQPQLQRQTAGWVFAGRDIHAALGNLVLKMQLSHS